MNKKILTIAVVAMLSIILAVSVNALSSVTIIFDGEELESDTEPIIENGRTLVPLRVIAEKFDADVTWDGDNNKVVIDTDKDKTDNSDSDDANESDKSNWEEKIEFEDGYYRPEQNNIPNEIQEWINYSKEVPAVQEKQYEGYRFVLVTEGTKPTGGYDVEVTEVVEGSDQIDIKVRSTEPGEDELVTEALTYPYDLIIVENNDLPLNFIDVEDPDRYFKSFIGIDTIESPIVAESEYIKVFSPEPGDEIEDKVKLTGLASVFEGTVSYDLVTEDGEVVYKDHTTAAMGDWGYFEEEVEIPSDVDEEITLKLYSTSMKDGSKQFVVEIPLNV
ncbi:Gmad2 immunoglobulin-like domain-containing protein [Natranaerobius thermophilus]|uniref:Copper amine oxidase domain protein n=1 Tax=Natranaerobius thermophilus (strain ATCC BAA-1301 / DSM 18059 / JW/NM-WN-LF) TaxID=457570 RepID=B2A412_NATTJ|nr:Gmad2 immunoglobulin-like domain-containing protein [Natranaerobius thermophilus]ACB85114.1 copper amine oxidase domain protein [Natranaerobius thermophilus JW/NM-WN-LF]